MARFTLGTTGAGSINTGVGNLFRALAQAPYLRAQAEQQAGLRSAQAYSAAQAGDKYRAQADTERFDLGQRQGVDAMIEANPGMEPFRRSQLMALKLVGPQFIHNYANAGETEQKIQSIQDIQRNPALATATGKAYAATSGKMPFSAAGVTGRSINELTGEGGTLEGTLAKLYDNKTLSETGENAAQAKNALASADRHRASTEKTKLETGLLRDTDTTGPLSGKPLTNAQRRTNTEIDETRKFLESVPPSRIRAVMNKNDFDLTPADKDLLARVKKARTPKFGETGVPEQFNNALGLDPAIVASTLDRLMTPQSKSTLFGFGPSRPMTEEETIGGIRETLPDAERGALDDYIAAARMRMGAPATAPATAAAKSGPAPAQRKAGGDPVLAKLPPGSRQIGTSKGRPVYQAPNGKKFIVE